MTYSCKIVLVMTEVIINIDVFDVWCFRLNLSTIPASQKWTKVSHRRQIFQRNDQIPVQQAVYASSDRLQGSVEELASGMESEQDVVSVYLFKIFTIILILGQTVTPFG